MNYLQKNSWNRILKTQIRQSNRCGCHNGCFRLNSHNSDAHEDVKYQIYKKLIKQGYDVWTEAIFLDGSRADIVAIKEGKGHIIEIMHSETEIKMLEKKEKYPVDFEIITVKTKDFDINKLEI